MNQQALEKYLWGAATLLRGTIDAGDYKQYIFPLLFYKRICDVYDEEFEIALKESDGDREYAGFDEHHRFQIPKGAHWSDVRETTATSAWRCRRPCAPSNRPTRTRCTASSATPPGPTRTPQ